MATAVRPQPPPVAVGHPEPPAAAAPVEGTTQTHTNVAQDVNSKFHIWCEWFASNGGHYICALR
jgi:hypothetical protein